MRVRNFTFVALLATASAVMAQNGKGYEFTDIVSNKATSVKIRQLQEHAGVLQLLRLWNLS